MKHSNTYFYHLVNNDKRKPNSSWRPLPLGCHDKQVTEEENECCQMGLIVLIDSLAQEVCGRAVTPWKNFLKSGETWKRIWGRKSVTSLRVTKNWYQGVLNETAWHKTWKPSGRLRKTGEPTLWAAFKCLNTTGVIFHYNTTRGG